MGYLFIRNGYEIHSLTFLSPWKNYPFGGQLCMPDWLLIVSKIESSFKGKIFVNIGDIQTWRAFPKGNYKMKNCTITCLWNKNIVLPSVSFKWNNLPLDMSHFGMRVTKTVILLILTQLMREWHNISSKNER